MDRGGYLSYPKDLLGVIAEARPLVTTAGRRDAPHGRRGALARLRPPSRRPLSLGPPPRRPPPPRALRGGPLPDDALAAAQRLLPRAVRRDGPGRGSRPPRPARTDASRARGDRGRGPARRPPGPAALRTDRPIRRRAGKRPRGDARALPGSRASPRRSRCDFPSLEPGSIEGVFAPWSAGHFVTALTGYPAAADPFGYGWRRQARLFTATDDAEAERILAESRCRWLFTTDLRAVLPAYAAAAGRPGTPPGETFSVRVHEAATSNPVPFLELALDSRTAYRTPGGRVVPRFRIWRVRTATEQAEGAPPAPSAP